MHFEQALKSMGENESFRATVYAMNTLLLRKGIYSSSEFEALFCEHAENYRNKFKGKSRRARSVGVGQ